MKRLRKTKQTELIGDIDECYARNIYHSKAGAADLIVPISEIPKDDWKPLEVDLSDLKKDFK